VQHLFITLGATVADEQHPCVPTAKAGATTEGQAPLPWPGATDDNIPPIPKSLPPHYHKALRELILVANLPIRSSTG
jgi:hypothetical protein